MAIVASSATALYRKAIKEVIYGGMDVKPRGIATKELRGVTLELTDPYMNLVASKARHLNPAFAVAECMWILCGRNDVATVTCFNKQIAQFSDDGMRFNGAYGPKVVEQLPYIVETLRKDPDSRQAVMTVWRERPGVTKDIPCTIMFQFFVRDGHLELITYMRSNDLWLGFPYDLFNFTTLQMYIASQLELKVGRYRHMVGSLHLYAHNLEKAREVALEMEVPKLGFTPYPPAGAVPLSVEYWFLGLAGGVLDGFGHVLDSELDAAITDPFYRGALAAMHYHQFKRPDMIQGTWVERWFWENGR